MTSSEDIASFRRAVWAHYKKEGRHALPWRKTRDPYKIFVSEVMLQQTQVPRVIPKYKSFIKAFPTVRALAKAPLAAVLKEWNGLGYNRRAKHLHDAAKTIVAKFGGKVPSVYGELVGLPGVGDYTARAIRVFASDEPDTLIETNVRTAIIHHFFPHTPKVCDRNILVYARAAARGQDPRTWHWALMDYGAHLKSTGVRTNAQSTAYAKQSRFKGSVREVRGAILRALHAGKQPGTLPFAREKIASALTALARDGLIRKAGTRWRIV